MRLSPNSDKAFDYNDATKMVFDSFSAFDPKIAEMAQRVFDQEHVDSEVRKGKRDGAFCWSVLPEMTPYVLLNYTGRARDVATMAHELGHAIHAMLASHHNTFTFRVVSSLSRNCLDLRGDDAHRQIARRRKR